MGHPPAGFCWMSRSAPTKAEALRAEGLELKGREACGSLAGSFRKQRAGHGAGRWIRMCEQARGWWGLTGITEAFTVSDCESQEASEEGQRLGSRTRELPPRGFLAAPVSPAWAGLWPEQTC